VITHKLKTILAAGYIEVGEASESLPTPSAMAARKAHSSFRLTDQRWHYFRYADTIKAAMVVFDATQRIGAVSQFLAHKSPSSAFVYLQENDGMLAQDAMDNLVLA
jgi:hypothetical protein